ncbi:MAG TPA: PEP-utilizing enzyme [Pseudonocardia sp.]|jgi:pyruvate,water dikinase
MFDPLHIPGGPETYWTTINAEENLPGVVTPLSSSFWLRPVTVGTLGAFADLGVLAESEVRYSDDVDQRICSVMYGRFAANVDLLRRCADRTPGTSGDALEQQLFSNVRPGIPARNNIRRYGIVAVKAPAAAAGVAGRIRAGFLASQVWWRRSIDAAPHDDLAAARGRLAEANNRMAAMMRPHTLGTFVTSGVFDQLRALASAANRPGLDLELSRGLGAVEETEMLSMLWDASRGRTTVEDFLRRYGFHGPGEAAASSSVWREQPETLKPLIASYRDMPENRSPAAAARAVAGHRREAAEQLMASLPRAKRPMARAVLAMSDRVWPLRETGKATLLHAIDVGRAAARRLGELMAADGQLENPSDTAHLTVEELTSSLSRGGWPEQVDYRRARRQEYLTYSLPQTWAGVPAPVVSSSMAAAEPVRSLTALGGSPGIAEGRVRVMHDPYESELTDGEVLVCECTDPSWATHFLMASAVVIDVGGPMSHGAIVARELGIPCVINTRSGTRTLRDGDKVRVNGNTGTVTLLA